ncbi:MAG: helix-turn-helix transcriptional regulator [Burkholderiales bacterium]|nr:helix-turn-helix transcriptional regulator [Burkholderiales bacterium]
MSAMPQGMTTTTHRMLFESEWLQVGHISVRPASSECGELEASPLNVLALPLAGVFAKHDGPRRHGIATPQHALLISAGRPYRLSFPGCIGDRCLALRLSNEALAHVMPEALAGSGMGTGSGSNGGFDEAVFATQTLLPPAVMLARSQLWRRLAAGGGEVDALEAEQRAIDLLAAALGAARRQRAGSARGGIGARGADGADGAVAAVRAVRGGGATWRRMRPVARTVEAIGSEPERRWTLHELAALACVSPSHLAHVFRAETGLSVWGYVLRSRLARGLEAVLDSDAALTEVALDAGFASHSHFTAKFRTLFGCTPQQLRRGASRRTAHEMRRIATAHEPLAA